jgi:hypothetical protein
MNEVPSGDSFGATTACDLRFVETAGNPVPFAYVTRPATHGPPLRQVRERSCTQVKRRNAGRSVRMCTKAAAQSAPGASFSFFVMAPPSANLAELTRLNASSVVTERAAADRGGTRGTQTAAMALRA